MLITHNTTITKPSSYNTDLLTVESPLCLWTRIHAQYSHDSVLRISHDHELSG